MTSEERAALLRVLERAEEMREYQPKENFYSAAYGYLREAVASLLATSERKEPEP